ncbi:MAG TPA: transposase [Thermomicrobiales bacterium]|jgi:REP element-mobilizing transposase RayT
MPYDPDRHHRRSIRLPGYDYSRGGAYFVTICVQGRACSLGAVIDGEMRLSEQGEIVAGCWAAITDHFPKVVLDASVIMPNHLHGIVFLSDSQISAGRPTLAKITGDFKSASARRINAQHGTAGSFWQRGYYEHIVRNEHSLARLQTYIAENPQRWAMDQLYRDSVNET